MTSQAVTYNRSTEPFVLLALATLLLVLSGVGPTDRLTWLLEVLPVLVALPLLVATHGRFPLSPLAYRLIFVHACILMLGGHYTYAQVPLGFWLQETFDLARNHYDRLGHFAQGFVPAIVAREILLRCSPLPHGKWLVFLVICFCLAFSAFYELIEWWSALAYGAQADAFLATQGDVWDTQWDMFLALLGAVTALAILSHAHDRSIEKVAQ